MSDTENTETEAKPSKKKLIIIIALVLILGGGGGYWWFFMKSSGPKEPVPGEVLVLDPIQVNLAEGHYLRFGLALQFTEDAAYPEGSKAMDLAIDTFSGREMEELSSSKKRHEIKDELEEYIIEEYHHEVIEIYFTEFVTQ